MLKTQLILSVVSIVVIGLLFLLPKAVVENDSRLTDSAAIKKSKMTASHHQAMSASIAVAIKTLRRAYAGSSSKEKNAIFADSLQSLYTQAQLFDSAAMYGVEAATFFNNIKSFLKVGNNYYQAYTFAMNAQQQRIFAEKTREWLGRVVAIDPKNYEARTKVAMTYLSSGAPMQGIMQIRDVLKEDPQNEFALYNMGMLAVQSGQNSKAIGWLTQLAKVNPRHVQGQLLLGVAYLKDNQKTEARKQFDKVKQMDHDPAVQTTVDTYLNELK